MQPTIFIQSLCCLLRVLQVPLEDIFALDTDLEMSEPERQSEMFKTWLNSIPGKINRASYRDNPEIVCP